MSRINAAVLLLAALVLGASTLVWGHIPPVSHLSQFRMQCLSGVPNTQTSTKNRFDLVREYFGVIQVGPQATPEVINPYNVCTSNAPWMRDLLEARVGSWDAKSLFLGNRSATMYFNGAWHQTDMFGSSNYLPGGDKFKFGGTPVPGGGAIVYQVNESSVTYDGERENSYGVLYAFNQGLSRSVFIPCYESFHSQAKCLTSYNSTDFYDLDSSFVLSVKNNQAVTLSGNKYLGISVSEFPKVYGTVVVTNPCDMVSNIQMKVLYENRTYSIEMGQDAADGVQKYILMWGDDKDGFLRVCRLEGDMTDTTNQTYYRWATNTNMKATVSEVTADTYTIVISATVTSGGDSQEILLPITSTVGEVQIPLFTPHPSENTPTAVGDPGQRRFIVQYNGRLKSVETGSKGSTTFSTNWDAFVGCENAPAVWRDPQGGILLCWSNGQNKSNVPKGVLMMVNATSGEVILDSKVMNVPGVPLGHQETYNAMHFGIPSIQSLGLPFQLTLPPKSTSPMLWFLGTQLPDQVLRSPAPTDVHCLIGMALDIPRASRCNVSSEPGHGGGSNGQGHDGSPKKGGDSTTGKVVIALIIICFIAFLIAAITIGYRKHRSRRDALILSAHGASVQDFDGRLSGPSHRTGTMLLYGELSPEQKQQVGGAPSKTHAYGGV